MRKSSFFVANLLGLLMLGAGTGLYAQEAAGSITGVVRDVSGAVVPDASILAKASATGVSTEVKSDATGIYNFRALSPGYYTVTATKVGFKSAEYPNIRMVSAEAVSLDILLAVGASTQRVTVTGASAGVDITRTDTGTTRVTEEVAELPFNGGAAGVGREAFGFLRAMPGVNYGVSGGTGFDTLMSGASIYGVGGASGEPTTQRSVSTPVGYMINGVSAASESGDTTAEQAGVTPEAISEFRLDTDVNAEYGNNMGAMISFVMKSGTNRFHGEGFEFFENTKLDARTWESPGVSKLRNHEDGGNLGGPIVKNKTFFFFAFDNYRYQTPSSLGYLGTVPSVLMRQGNFSEWLGPQTGTDALGRPVYEGEIYDPSTTRTLPNGTVVRDPYAYNGVLNTINPTTFSNVSQFFQNQYPLPNLPGLTNNIVGVGPTFGRELERIDFNVDQYLGNGKLSVSANLLDHYDQYGACVNSFQSNPADFLSCVDYRPSNKKARISYSLSLSPRTFLEVSGAINDNLQLFKDAGAGYTAGAKSPLTGLLTPNGPFIVMTTSYTGTGTSVAPTPLGFPIYNQKVLAAQTPLSASLTMVRGRHTLKFGVQGWEQVSSQHGAIDTSGAWAFGPLESGLPTFGQTGNAYASFMAGNVDNVTMNVPTALRYSSPEVGVYAEDQWRVTPKFTLNYGLRWDVGEPPKEQFGRASTFDPTLPNPAAGNLLGAETFYGFGPGRNGRMTPENIYYGAWGPRIGVAYQFLPKTVVRSYYGIVYEPATADPFPQSNGTFGTLTLATENAGVTPGLNWNNGFPDNEIPPGTPGPSIDNGGQVDWINPSQNQVARSHQFGFSMEREVPGGIVIKGEYVGKFTHHQMLSLGQESAPYNNGDEYDQMPISDLKYGNLLLDDINSPQAQAAGIPVPYPGFTGSVAQALRPYPQYTSVVMLNDRIGYSDYNAGILSAQKHVGNGLTFLGGLTWSKLIGAAIPQDLVQTKTMHQIYVYTLSTDLRWSFVFSWVYQLPFGPGRPFLHSNNAFTKYVIGDWQVSAIQRYQAGTPFQVSGNETIPGIGPVWMDRVPGVPERGAPCKNYNPFGPNPYLMNKAAFEDPAPFTFGNTLTSDVTACAEYDEYLSLRKKIPVGERVNLELGADVFNLFNRHVPGVFPYMNNNADSESFGLTTTSSQAPRNVQLILRATF